MLYDLIRTQQDIENKRLVAFGSVSGNVNENQITRYKMFGVTIEQYWVAKYHCRSDRVNGSWLPLIYSRKATTVHGAVITNLLTTNSFGEQLGQGSQQMGQREHVVLDSRAPP